MLRQIKSFNLFKLNKRVLCNLMLFITVNVSASAEGESWQAVTENFPPYNFLEDEKPQGYATDLVYELAATLKLDLTVEVLPWSRAMLKAESEPNVLIFSMLRTPERENKYHWIGPIDDMSIYVWQRKDNLELKIKPESQITYAASRSLDALNVTMLTERVGASEPNIITVETTEQLIGLLARQRVDRIVLAENIWREIRKSLSEEDISKFERVELLAERQLFLAASLQTDVRAINALTLAFDKISNESTVIALRELHGID